MIRESFTNFTQSTNSIQSVNTQSVNTVSQTYDVSRPGVQVVLSTAITGDTRSMQLNKYWSLRATELSLDVYYSVSGTATPVLASTLVEWIP